MPVTHCLSLAPIISFNPNRTTPSMQSESGIARISVGWYRSQAPSIFLEFGHPYPDSFDVQAKPSAPQPAAIKRRHFLKSTSAFGASVLIAPRLRLFGANAPSNKLNIA